MLLDNRYHPQDLHHVEIVDFHQARKIWDPNDPVLYGLMAADQEPGDWKTATAHQIPGVKIGMPVKITNVWTNLHGRWARIERPNHRRSIDVLPESIRIVTKAEYDEVLSTFPELPQH